MGPPLVVSWLSGLFYSRQSLPCVRGSDGRTMCSDDRATCSDVARSILALRLRQQRQARHAGSVGSVSGSSGPVEGKASGSTPVTREEGKGLTSPRSVAGSRDGGRGSPSAVSLSSVAADDCDTGCNTSLGPRSQDGGSGVRSSYPPLRGAAEALSRQAFRRRSHTLVRLRHSSGSSSYACATVRPTGAARTRPGPDRTRTGPGMETGPGPGRTRLEAAGSPDQTGTSRSGGMLVRVTAAVVRASEDSDIRVLVFLCVRLLTRIATPSPPSSARQEPTSLPLSHPSTGCYVGNGADFACHCRRQESRSRTGGLS